MGGPVRAGSRTAGRSRSDASGPGDIAMLLQMIVGAWPFDLDAATARAGAPSPSAWPAGSRRRCARPSSAATGPRSTKPTKRRRAVHLGALGRRRAARPAAADRRPGYRIAPAGALNGLAQSLLRMTVPGVPDLYQGSELWDFSLVDPDNRRPVDWPRRVAGPARAARRAGGRMARRPRQAGTDRARPGAAPAPRRCSPRATIGRSGRGAAGRCHDRLRPPPARVVGPGGGAAARVASAAGPRRRASGARWLAAIRRSCWTTFPTAR